MGVENKKVDPNRVYKVIAAIIADREGLKVSLKSVSKKGRALKTG